MPGVHLNPPQAFVSSYAPRIRTFANPLLAPVVPQTSNVPPIRTTKRGTAAINYAEDLLDEDFDDGEDAPRRPTGLKSRPNVDPSAVSAQGVLGSQLGRELTAPVDVQGIWRDWMGKPKKTLSVDNSLIRSKPFISPKCGKVVDENLICASLETQNSSKPRPSYPPT